MNIGEFIKSPFCMFVLVATSTIRHNIVISFSHASMTPSVKSTRIFDVFAKRIRGFSFATFSACFFRCNHWRIELALTKKTVVCPSINSIWVLAVVSYIFRLATMSAFFQVAFDSLIGGKFCLLFLKLLLAVAQAFDFQIKSLQGVVCSMTYFFHAT